MGRSASVYARDSSELLSVNSHTSSSKQLRQRSGSQSEYHDVQGEQLHTLNKLGLRLWHLKDFILSCGGEDSLRGMTTIDVSRKFILPQLLHKGGSSSSGNGMPASYCEILSKQPHNSSSSPTKAQPSQSSSPMDETRTSTHSNSGHSRNIDVNRTGSPVADAEVYVIHSLHDVFLQTVEALMDHFEQSPNIVIWMDIFCLNSMHGSPTSLGRGSDSPPTLTAAVSVSSFGASAKMPSFFGMGRASSKNLLAGGSGKMNHAPRQFSTLTINDKEGVANALSSIPMPERVKWFTHTLPEFISSIGHCVVVLTDGHASITGFQVPGQLRSSSSANGSVGSSSGRQQQKAHNSRKAWRVLRRTWCLYEVFACLQLSKVTLDLAFGQETLSNIIDELTNDAPTVLYSLFKAIDIDQAISTYSVHHDAILSVIDVYLKNNMGKDDSLHCTLKMRRKRFNYICYEHIRDALVRCLEESLQQRSLASLQDLINTRGSFSIGSPAGNGTPSPLKDVSSSKGKAKTALERVKISLQATLARLYQLQGNRTKATDLLETLMPLSEIYYGRTHLETLRVGQYLAALYLSAHRVDERCEELVYHIAKTTKEKLGNEHLDTIRSFQCLALFYMGTASQGQVEDVKETFIQAENILRDCRSKSDLVNGPSHWLTLSVWEDLAALHDTRGQRDEAIAIYKSTQEHRLTLLGEYHPDTINVMYNLGCLYYDLSQYDEAEQRLKHCLQLRRIVLGENHLDTLMVLLSLATLKESKGDHDGAEKLLLERWQGYRSSLGENAPQTLLVHFELGQWYDERGMKEKARTSYLDHLDRCKKQYGPTHDVVMGALLHLKDFYLRNGEDEKAKALRI